MKDVFNKIINHLKTSVADSSLNPTQKAALLEAIAKLNSIADQAIGVMQRNEHLLEADPRIREIKEFMSEENINKMMSEQAKTDPALAVHLKAIGSPLVINGRSEVSAYDMSRIDEAMPENMAELTRLHEDTETVYRNLWTVKQRLNQLFSFKNFNPSGVRDVRNHLIEHVEGKGSGAYINSFGVATNGPVLRPIKPTGVKAPHDKGLKANLLEFLEDIEKRLI